VLHSAGYRVAAVPRVAHSVASASNRGVSGADSELTFLTVLSGGPRHRKADDEVPCDLAVTMRA
jgi:hypothetical protein